MIPAKPALRRRCSSAARYSQRGTCAFAVSAVRRLFDLALVLGLILGPPVNQGVGSEADPAHPSPLRPVLLPEVELPDFFRIETTYLGEVFTNARGGINTSRATEYRGLLALSGEIDVATISSAKDARLMALAQLGQGRGISGEHTGDFQLLSNIDADQFLQISEVWWEQWFAASTIRVKLGRQDANVDFAMLDEAGLFVHSSLGLPPTVPMPTFPDPGLGAALFVETEAAVTFGAGVYEGSPNGGRLGLSRLLEGGVFLIGQSSVEVRQAGALPGTYHVGGWYHSPDVAEISGDATFSGNYGLYLGAEQRVWSFDGEPDRGVALIVQLGWAPHDRNQLDRYFGTGVVFTGPIPSRREDSMAFGVAHARFSERLPALSFETAIEYFYRIQATPSIALQPELQYIVNPGGNGTDAIATGLRFEIVY